ncbi:biopolymer transporter ExbD [Parabacteroides merdae]|jgi:biopolymer transport protein ExbD|uniref:ExbD/TolR family protein n=1 Tax=Parabacteroides merdae TaxID=46503 RepID=UPI000EFA474C|nr:biopolymer transporter ExbD [Parabacteroides merdae]RGS98825.1 biopolymer transporter ExbD [Parabacteroides merdae]
MAEVNTDKGKNDGKKGKQKKMTVRVDFTPMVDMNMLLITFFMLCTSLSKPQTMEISMPSKDQVTEAEQTKVKASKAITLLLGEDDKIYYYFGEPDYEHAESLQQTDYSPAGLRDILLERNFDVARQMKELKLKKLNKEISEDDFKKQATEIKGSKEAPVVLIKATDDASYRNLVDALDEMQICNIGKYAIVDITDGDKFLIDNLKSGGELTKQIARSNPKK